MPLTPPLAYKEDDLDATDFLRQTFGDPKPPEDPIAFLERTFRPQPVQEEPGVMPIPEIPEVELPQKKPVQTEKPSYAEVVGKGLVRGVKGLAGGVGAITHWAGEATGLEPVARVGKEASDYWKKSQLEGMSEGEKELYSGTFMENPSIKRAVGIISEALPSLGAAVVTGGAGVAAGLSRTAASWLAGSALGLLEGAPQYEEAREAGKGVGSASLSGLASTAGTAILESLAIGKFLKLGKVTPKAAGKFAGKFPAIAGAGTGAVVEGMQEGSQQLWQNLVAKLGYDETQELAEGLVEAMIGGAGAGGIAGGTIAKFNRVAEKAKESGVTDEEVKQATNDIKSQIETKAATEPLLTPKDIIQTPETGPYVPEGQRLHAPKPMDTLRGMVKGKQARYEGAPLNPKAVKQEKVLDDIKDPVMKDEATRLLDVWNRLEGIEVEKPRSGAELLESIPGVPGVGAKESVKTELPQPDYSPTGLEKLRGAIYGKEGRFIPAARSRGTVEDIAAGMPPKAPGRPYVETEMPTPDMRPPGEQGGIGAPDEGGKGESDSEILAKFKEASLKDYKSNAARNRAIEPLRKEMIRRKMPIPDVAVPVEPKYTSTETAEEQDRARSEALKKQREAATPSESTKVKRKELDVFYVDLPNKKKVEVIKNPTVDELRQLSKEFRNEFPDAKGEPYSRSTYDADGNEYIWRSDQATHDMVEPIIAQKFGTQVSQNKHMLEATPTPAPTPQEAGGSPPPIAGPPPTGQGDYGEGEAGQPKTREELEQLKQMLEDHISMRREDGKEPNQAHIDKLAEVKAQLGGTEIPTDGIASQAVFGHPEATSFAGYENLIPIRVKDRATIEKFRDRAQRLFDQLSEKIGRAEAIKSGKITVTPKQKKEAISYLSSANYTEDVTKRDMIRNETMKELGRLDRLLPESTQAAGTAEAKPEAAPAPEPTGKAIGTESVEARRPIVDDNLDLIELGNMDRIKAVKERFPELSAYDALRLSVQIKETATGTKGSVQEGEKVGIPKNWKDYNEKQERIETRKKELAISVGTAWVKNQWRPITASKQITRGKNKGKWNVTLPDGSHKIVETVKMAETPDAGKEAETERPPKKGIELSAFDSFVEKLPPMQKGKVTKSLSAKIRTKDYGITTKREMVERLIADGRTPKVVEKLDKKLVEKAKEERSNIYSHGDQNIQADRVKQLDKIIANPPNKIEYRLEDADGIFFDINKTEHDYAVHLMAGKEAKVEPQVTETKEPNLIATEKGSNIEFRVSRFNDPTLPQMKYQVQMRQKGSEIWDTAMVGMGINKKAAIRKLAENYERTWGRKLENLEISNPDLQEAVDKELAARAKREADKASQEEAKRIERQKELKAQKQREENERAIAQQMKGIKATKKETLVPVREGPKKKVEATAFGDWGYHKHILYDKQYTVTHLPSGLNVGSFDTAKEARELAYRLSLMENRWDGVDRKNTDGQAAYQSFIDEAKATTQQFKERVPMGKGIPRFQAFTPPPNTRLGIPRQSLERIADIARRGWRNAPKFVIVDSQDKLPQRYNRQNKVISGAYAASEDTVYLVAGNMPSKDFAMRSIFHEAWGHKGFDLIRESKQAESFNRFLDRLYATKKADLEKIGRDRGFDLATKEGRDKAADEWLARQAEKNPNDTWVARAIAFVKEWLAKVFPNLKVSNAEIVKWLGDMRQGVIEGEPGVGTEEQARYQLAGEKAIGAPTGQLAKAQKMLEEGKSEQEVWDATGWNKEASGKWAFRIDDSGAKLTDKALKQDTRWGSLSDFLDHPELFKAYPELRYIVTNLWIEKGAYESGKFTPYNSKVDGSIIEVQAATPEKALGMLHHEVAHAIQDIEGFARGGNVKSDEAIQYAQKELDRKLQPIRQEMKEIYAPILAEAKKRNVDEDVIWAENPEKDKRWKELDRQVAEIGELPTSEMAYEGYRRLSGELYAREAGAQFKGLPGTMEGIPRDQWIVKDGEGTSFSVELPDAGKQDVPQKAEGGNPLKLWENIRHSEPVSFWAKRGSGKGTTELRPQWQSRYGRKYLLGDGIYVTPSLPTASKFGKVQDVLVSLNNPYVIRQANAQSLLGLDISGIAHDGHDGIVILKGQAGFGPGQENMAQAVVFPGHENQVEFKPKPAQTGILEKGAKVKIVSIPEYIKNMHPEVEVGMEGVVTSMAFGIHPSVKLKKLKKTYSLNNNNVELISSRPSSEEGQARYSTQDQTYLSLAERYESGDKSVLPELQRMVDEAARAEGLAQFGGYFLDSIPTIPQKYLSALQRGQELAIKQKKDGIYKDMTVHQMRASTDIGNSKLEQILFELGWRGYKQEELVPTVGFRVGDIPKSGLSRDASSGVVEYGVSIAGKLDGNELPNPTFYDDMLSERGDRQYVAGFLNPYYDGADGEPLLLFPVKMKNAANSIKSADPITRDDQGRIIPLSQRFNPQEEDIRYQTVSISGAESFIPETPKDKLKSTLSKNFDNFMYWVVDKNQPIASVQKQLATVRDDIDVFLKETQRPKRMSARVAKAWDEDVMPLITAMAQEKVNIPDLELYLQAMHTPEANASLRLSNAKRMVEQVRAVFQGVDRAKVKDINKMIGKAKKPNEWYAALTDIMAKYQNDPDAADAIRGIERFYEKPSGMTDEEAAKVLEQYKGDRDKLDNLRKYVDEMNRKALDLAYDAGQLEDEVYAKVKNKFKYYVPLQREGFDDTLYGPSRGLNPSARLVKVRGGSTRPVVNILANTIANYERAINVAEKARSQRALYGLIKENPDNGLLTLEQVPKSPRYDSYGNIRMYPNAMQVADDQMRLMVDGKQYMVTANRNNMDAMRLVRTLKAEDDMSGPVVNALSKVNRFLARVNTSWAPEFIISNFVRDLQTAGINVKDTGVKGKSMFSGATKAVKAIYAVERGKRKGTELEKYYDRFKEAGGKIGWPDVHGSVQNMAKNLTTELEMKSGQRPTRKAFTDFFRFIDDANTSIENGIRLHVFKLAVDQGKTDEQAARIASDLTVDFTKKGAAGPVINSLYLFANAGIQGSYRIIRAAATSKAVQRHMAYIAGAGFLVGMFNALMGGEDDAEDKYINKLDDAILERNAVFMLPGTEGKYVKVPLPWGYNFIWNLGTEMARAFTEEDYKPWSGAARTIHTFANAFNPISGGTLLQTIAPTVLDPIAQVSENKNWFGGPLMPFENKFSKTPTPDSQRYWSTTGVVSKWVSEQLNDLTGGNKVKSGLIDVSPETLNLIVDTIGGSAMRFAKDTLGVPFKAIQDEKVAWYKVPFWRRVAGEQSEWANSRTYYNNVENVNAVSEMLKVYKGTDEYQGIIDSTKAERTLIPFAKYIENDLRRLRKSIRNATAKGNKELVERLEKRVDDLYVKFNKRYYQTMRRFGES